MKKLLLAVTTAALTAAVVHAQQQQDLSPVQIKTTTDIASNPIFPGAHNHLRIGYINVHTSATPQTKADLWKAVGKQAN